MVRGHAAGTTGGNRVLGRCRRDPVNTMSTVPVTPEAKLWELLRRNDAFRNVVARLIKLDEKARAEKTIDARSEGFDLVRGYDASNSFAALALRWLVPNPCFT